MSNRQRDKALDVLIRYTDTPCAMWYEIVLCEDIYLRCNVQYKVLDVSLIVTFWLFVFPCLFLCSISEILFKPYPFQLKFFSAFICLSQFLTLISLFYSLLPCPDEKPSWLVFIGVPLCCAYGMSSYHHYYYSSSSWIFDYRTIPLNEFWVLNAVVILQHVCSICNIN